MSNVILWFQNNWLEAIMLLATLIAVVAGVLAVRVAVLALAVARQSAQSADEAHERNVRLQARTALAEARGSFHKLASECHSNLERWRQHQWAHGPKLSATPFAQTREMQEASSIKMQGSEVLRSALVRLQTIDQMTLDELEDAIPVVRQASTEIDALRNRLLEPSGNYH